MTSSSEHELKNEIDIDSLEKNEVKQETLDYDQILDRKGQSNDLTDETEDNKVTNGIDNGDALMNTSPVIVTTDEEQTHEATESTVNNDEDRSKITSDSKVKSSSMPYPQLPYQVLEQAYGPTAYYYYPSPPSVSLEKPAPLMLISAQKSPSSSISRDNQTSNSTSVSPQNLPPRLRQTSTTENDPNSPLPSTTSSSTAPPPLPPSMTNGRRHRSILPRGSTTYYSPHPPPPLMATPPGVLYTYPPAVHSSGHIAYSIRPSDEFELLALQQQMMNLPPGSILWSPQAGLASHGHPIFSSYSMNGPPPPPPQSTYMFSNATGTQSANSFLNPDAAEWIPSATGNDSSSETQILIDDEINFPPLNSATNTLQPTANTKDVNENNSEPTDTIPETTPTNNLNDNPLISTDNSNRSSQANIKTESTTNSSSSQDDINKSSIKNIPVSYSTIISQASENNKLNQQRSQPQSTNHIQNKLPPRDRTAKQRLPVASSSNSRRRQPLNNNNQHRNTTRTQLTSETNSLPKQQQQQQPSSSTEISDDWIEVKSKKTKKFDRLITDNNPSEKLLSDEPIPKSHSPPLSLTSTGDNTTTTTVTSEDDFDEKDTQDLVIITSNDRPNDCNRIILDDIHRRLNNKEKLLIIMRGCPGSGKSTLAKSLNHGHNGVILSSDDYFTDTNSNTYLFDHSKIDDAHRFTRRRASDALKTNVSPIIIDNTNTQVWEMKPYVAMGKEAGYEILLVEPQTPWRYKARELVKRNLHNLPLRRIKDMLNRFEHNITAQNILDQLPSIPKSTNSTPFEPQTLHKDQEIIDPILTPKKVYDIIDDSLILDDVRLCINDMILFVTSNYFQTTRSSQCSTPLSVSFHDLSLISSTPSSLPSTPSTPHSRFHRSLGRFPSSINPDHSFNTDLILRSPPTTLPRCIETNNLTPPPSAQSNPMGKKRRKNKNKQQSDELVLNMNNNNNNAEQEVQTQQLTFNVYLPEDCSDFVVIDEVNTHDWIDTVNRNFESVRDHSSVNPCQEKQFTNPNTCELINIIRTELTKPSHHPSISTKHIAIQCSSEEFNSPIDHSDVVLIGHLSSSSTHSEFILPRSGYKECGIQVDFNEHNLDLLMQIYSNCLSPECIEQFYEVCHFDIQWTCSQIDEYLQNNHRTIFHVPTLKQLSLEKLNQWNEQIISTDPSFDTTSIGDLLQDINDEEVFEQFPAENSTIESNQINIPWSVVNSLEDIYGELPDRSLISSTNNGILLSLDDELARNIYQALERCSMKPVIDTKKKKKKDNNQKWKLPAENSNINTNGVPSFRQIMNEEQQATKSQKSKQKHQLDYATEHKLKELRHHFPSFDSDLLYDIFRENEYDYDVTFICISTMLDENASIQPIQKTFQPVSAICSTSTVEPVFESYENLRHDALRHAQRRKEFYTKAHQANRHGMSGVASFYIHRASEETRLMKDANRATCERLSRWRLKQFHQTQRLDLHGLHADEALNLFKQIEQEFNEGNRRTTPKSIEIITGYGKNSVYGGGHGKIRLAILAYLRQRIYKYSEPNKGVILLQFSNARNS